MPTFLSSKQWWAGVRWRRCTLTVQTKGLERHRSLLICIGGTQHPVFCPGFLLWGLSSIRLNSIRPFRFPHFKAKRNMKVHLLVTLTETGLIQHWPDQICHTSHPPYSSVKIAPLAKLSSISSHPLCPILHYLLVAQLSRQLNESKAVELCLIIC